MKFFGNFALIALTVISQIQGTAILSSECNEIFDKIPANNDENTPAFMTHAQKICRAHYQEERQIMACLCQLFKDKY